MSGPDRSRVIPFAAAQADIGEDLAVWVVFFGPLGGELPA